MTETRSSGIWNNLERVIADRIESRPAGSYVTELLSGGHAVMAGKVVEEAYELVEAAAEGDRPALIHEAADLWFHTLVLLHSSGVQLSDVEAELTGRFGVSGLTERGTRTERPA